MNPTHLFWQIKQDYRIQQVESEWIEFIKLISTMNLEWVMEIGAYSCGSAATFGHFSKNVISIDSKLTAFGKNKMPLVKKLCNYTYIVKDSHLPECMDLVNNALGNNLLDILFIDGDHTYDGAKKDFYAYKHLVKPGGMIVLHDIVTSKYHNSLGCKVFKLWEEIKDDYISQEINGGLNWGGIGIIHTVCP